jgi:TraM recognition site of TraD and TraG
VLGRTPGARPSPPHHATACSSSAPPCPNKTRGIVIPTIRRWRGPVIATSVKPDLLRATLHHRQQRGHTWLLDPFAASGLPAIRLNRDHFLAGLDDQGRPVDNTVIVFAPEHRQAPLRPSSKPSCPGSSAAPKTTTPTPPGPWTHPCSSCSTRPSTSPPLRRLDTYVSTLASQGVQLVAVFQDLAQVRRCYGNQAPTILTNFLAKILMAGTTDRELLDLLTHLLGKRQTLDHSTTHSPDGTRTTRHHDLATTHTLVQQPPGHALALLSHRPPVRVRVRPDVDSISS